MDNYYTDLCKIMAHYGSDKGHPKKTSRIHDYTLFYYSIFKELRNNDLRIFELGLGTNNINIKSNMGVNGKPCASLYGWRHFFPNSKVFGADIDKDILITFPNIKTFYCDQTDPLIIKKMWDEPLLAENFDIIIEDGLHTFEANVCFFENSIHKLKETGYYIIEDINENNINLFYKKIKTWEEKYPYLTFNFVLNTFMNRDDNNLLVIQYKNNL
jgi:hypothetical protein